MTLISLPPCIILNLDYDQVAWCGSGLDSENEPHGVKTLICGYAVKSSDLVYMTKSQGHEPTFLNSAVRM